MILYLMVGCPASGKSYFAKNYLWVHGDNICYVSRDEVRYRMVKDGEDYFSKEDEVFDEFVAEIKELLTTEEIDVDAVIADATHLHWGSRRKLLKALGILDNCYPWVEVIPVVMETSLQTCIERNEHRSGRECVPANIIIKMRNSMRSPWDDPYHYLAVMEVRNDY